MDLLRLRKGVEGVFEAKHSKFIASLEPVTSREQAEAHLSRVRSNHPKAKHHASAWRVLEPHSHSVIHHFDDDGEPGGTAGRPVLQVLEANRLINVSAVVTRYFGGIKLGAGGLVRAYSAAVSAALAAAEMEPHRNLIEITVRFDYEDTGAVEAVISRLGLRVLGREYEGGPRIDLSLEASALENLVQALAEATGGRAVVREV